MDALRHLSPFVRLVHDFVTPVGFWLPPREINDHALLYFKRASGRFHAGGASHPIANGSLFVMRPNVEHWFQFDTRACQHMLNIHLDLVERADAASVPFHRTGQPRRDLPILASATGDANALPERIAIDDRAAYEGLFSRLLHLFGNKTLPGKLELKAAMISVLAFVFGCAQRQGRQPLSVPHQRAIQGVVEYLHANFHRPLALPDLAARAHMSVARFAEAFRSQEGVTPMLYLRQLRIERAMAELAASERSIKEIAAMVGFVSVPHFTRVFASIAGVPPARYRAAETARPD